MKGVEAPTATIAPSSEQNNVTTVMIGIFNYIFNDLTNYIAARVEQTPEELDAAMGLVYEKELTWIAKKEERMAWEEREGEELADLENQLVTLTEMKNERDENNKLVQTVQERKELTQEIAICKSQAKVLKQQLEKFDDMVKQAKSEVASAEKELNEVKKKIKKERNRDWQLVRDAIERIFAQAGADRGASHGGDFEGVGILKMLRNIDTIFDSIQEELLQVPKTQRLASNDEIRERLDTYKQTCLLFDYIFSLARLPKNDLSEEKILLLEKLIPMALKRWNQLQLSKEMPKVHGLQHLVEQIRRFHGIAEYLEDWIEQMHQFVKQFDARAKIRDLKKATELQSYLENLATIPGVVAFEKEVIQKTKRNFKVSRDANQTVEERRSEERQAKRQRAVEREEALAAAGNQLPTTLETGHELNRGDYFMQS